MLNLLLKEQKHNIKKEYVIRLIYAFLILLSVVLLLWSVSIIPSFVSVQIEKKIFKPQQDILKQVSTLENGGSYDDYIKELNNKITLLAEPEYIVSDLVREIVSRQVRSVRLNIIEFVKNGDKAQVNISGVSNTRESLVEFSNLLEESEQFESVEVPFSSFARNVDIPFTVTINVTSLQ